MKKVCLDYALIDGIDFTCMEFSDFYPSTNLVSLVNGERLSYTVSENSAEASLQLTAYFMHLLEAAGLFSPLYDDDLDTNSLLIEELVPLDVAVVNFLEKYNKGNCQFKSNLVMRLDQNHDEWIKMSPRFFMDFFGMDEYNFEDLLFHTEMASRAITEHSIQQGLFVQGVKYDLGISKVDDEIIFPVAPLSVGNVMFMHGEHELMDPTIVRDILLSE